MGALIDDVAAHHPLDRHRVYATGMSNGGMLVYQLAALHPEWFAAIAPVSATIGGMMREGQSYLIPHPNMPVPVLTLHPRHARRIRAVRWLRLAHLAFPNRWKLGVTDAVSFGRQSMAAPARRRFRSR